MSNMDKSQAQFFPQPYPSAPCDSFNCLNRAVYFIGKPEGPANICHRLCQDCAESVVRSTPGELKHALPPMQPPKGMMLVDAKEFTESMDKLTAAAKDRELLLSRIAKLEAKEAKPVEAKPPDGGNKKSKQPESPQAAQGKEVKGDECSEWQ